MKKIKIGKNFIGEGEKTYIIGEIGINHNGDVNLAKKLMEIAKSCGCDAVKFQKRTVEKVYSQEELAFPRISPFGSTNGDLKRGLEFGQKEYKEIDKYAKELGIDWFASCWDKDSVDFMEKFNSPAYKIPSALLTNDALLKYTRKTGKPIILSTGMSTIDEIKHAVDVLGEENLVICHCTSTYPSALEEINLKVINYLKENYNCPIGYSGHERGYLPSVLSVMYGSTLVERHITIDRTLWGSDQAASLEPEGLRRMIRDIRSIPTVVGDGKKVVYKNEIPIIKKLRKVGAKYDE
ncbi:N-acetylneuraminate synthase family protein [bacterium]|nr:N-acetylneuraminate synthase family protein [bacterium]